MRYSTKPTARRTPIPELMSGVLVNGHEWAKRQAVKAGIGFTELSNGFATATDAAALQVICDRLGPARSGCSPNAGSRFCRCR
jgi:hypothetical protein